MPTDRMKISLILVLFYSTTVFSVYFVKEKLTALEQSMLCHYEEPSSEGLFIKTFANMSLYTCSNHDYRFNKHDMFSVFKNHVQTAQRES